MHTIYDARTDVLSLRLNRRPAVDRRPGGPGVVVHYDATGLVVQVDLPEASRRVDASHRFPAPR